MKKILKTCLIVLLAVVLVGGSIGGYFIYRFNDTYISKSQALNIAIKDAGVSAALVRDKDVDFERNSLGSWFDVEFEVPGMEYDYTINALTGEIVYSDAEIDN
jgi:uncharacterized membrane protein YkoI